MAWSWGRVKGVFEGLGGRSWGPERLVLRAGDRTRPELAPRRPPVLPSLSPDSWPRKGEEGTEFEVASAPIGPFRNLLQNNSIITNRQARLSWPQKHT